MKICFLVPPPLDGKPAAERIFGCNYGVYNQPNIFMLYVATVLQKAGHEVLIKDCVIEHASVSAFQKFITENSSDIYFLGTVFLSKTTDLKAREMIRLLQPHARFCYYSTEPTAHPEDFAAEDTVIIRGEPEMTSQEVVAALEKKTLLQDIRGIVFSSGGKLVDTGYREPLENLDVLPFPDRSLLPKRNYNNPKLSVYPFTTILTSRGCPYRCYYCVPNSLSFSREIDLKKKTGAFLKPRFRSRSVDNVVQEVRMLARQGYRSFSILDDLFAFDNQWTIDFCQKIQDLRMEWSCLSRADHMTDPAMVQAMGKAGCKFVAMGIESFHQDILKFVRKDLDLGTVPVAVQNMKKAGIEVVINVLFASCDLETEKTILETYRTLKQLDPDYVLFSACTPFPYTEFNQIAREKGWMVEPEYRPVDPMKSAFISYSHLSKERIEKLLRRVYIGFYFRPSYLWKKLCKVKSPLDFINKIKAALNIFR